MARDDIKALEAQYKKLAKRADNSLRQLEKASRQAEYKGVKEYAYRAAQQDLKRLFPPNPKEVLKPEGLPLRFERSVKGLTVRQIQARINAVQRFLDAPSHSIKGINALYQQRAETLNAKLGTDFTWRELAGFWEFFDSKRGNYASGSDVMLKAYHSALRARDNPDAIKKDSAGKMILSDDKAVNEQAVKLFNDPAVWR